MKNKNEVIDNEELTKSPNEQARTSREKKKSVLTLFLSLVVFGICYFICKTFGLVQDFEDMFVSLNLNFEIISKVCLALSFVWVINRLVTSILRYLPKVTEVAVIISLVNYACPILGIGWILSIIGVEIQTIVASIGILALAISFGAESLIEDCISGLFIIGEKQFKLNDHILVDGFRGKVVNMGIRVTEIKDENGNIKFINNSNLKNLVNVSKEESTEIVIVTAKKPFDKDEFTNRFEAFKTNSEESNKWKKVNFDGINSFDDTNVTLVFKITRSNKGEVTPTRSELLTELDKLLYGQKESK